MAQLLVSADNGQVACVASDSHVWSRREVWPAFVVLRVPQGEQAARVLVEANRNGESRAFVNLDALSAAAVTSLSTAGAADIASLALLTVANVPGTSAALATATLPRAAEKAAFVAWGLDPTPEKWAAYEAAKAGQVAPGAAALKGKANGR